MNIPNGVRTETITNTEFEVGLILKNKFTNESGFSKENDVLCATTGGIKVNISAQKQVIKFDGVLDNTVGVERVVGWTGSVQFSTKEVDANMVKLALGFASESSGKITLNQGVITQENYKPIYILGKMGDGTWRQVCLKNAINAGGLQETRNDKGETEIAFDLQANYGIDTQDTPPIEIEYIQPTQTQGNSEGQV